VIFERPLLLWLAPFLGLGVTLLAFWARHRRVSAAAAWSASLGNEAKRTGRRSPYLLGLAALLAGVAIAGPRWGLASSSAESRALNVVFVMDISRSMLAQDAEPDRLTRSIRVARRLVQDLSGDRLGLVVFAARAYLLSPLTLDQSALAVQLDALDPNVASEGGSSLGAALGLARQVLREANEGGDRAVVLFTDGEAFDGERAVVTAGDGLKEDGIAMIVVPVGGTEGARIPDGDGGWHLDQLGQPVVTSRRDEMINALRDASGATVVDPNAADPAGEVRRALDRLDRRTVRDQMAADLVPRAWIFALAAAVLIAIQTATRRSAALVGIALVLGVGNAAAQRPTSGWKWLERGDTARAAQAFLDEAKRIGTDTAWFNAGTSALIRGDFAGAIGALERASLSLDPDLRRRALYNLGTAQLHAARQAPDQADSLVISASNNLRQALQLDPRDQATKFNYELARRMLPPPPPPQSGGGGGDDPQQGESGSQSQGRQGMNQAEAEQVLSAMERAERQTREDLARKQRRSPPRSGPDW
jgi:Ca-activated chloride channel family protein